MLLAGCLVAANSAAPTALRWTAISTAIVYCRTRGTVVAP